MVKPQGNDNLPTVRALKGRRIIVYNYTPPRLRRDDSIFRLKYLWLTAG
ncbi:MAG: hypothetical protein AB1757_06010 [Acidobacteriota bacterium]